MKKSNISNYLQLAAQAAMPTDNCDMREFWIGCVGIRTDGAVIISKNSSIYTTDVGDNFQIIPMVHAEPRALRKLNWGSIMFVARVMRNNNEYGMARPCPTCQIFIKSKGIKKVYYTINSKFYGVFYPKSDTDRIFKIRGIQ